MTQKETTQTKLRLKRDNINVEDILQIPIKVYSSMSYWPLRRSELLRVQLYTNDEDSQNDEDKSEYDILFRK